MSSDALLTTPVGSGAKRRERARRSHFRRVGQERLERAARLLEELGFFGSRCSSKHEVAVRKAAETVNNHLVGYPTRRFVPSKLQVFLDELKAWKSPSWLT